MRETLFNILSQRIADGTRFLDLCAGTGAIGIEAISRGATFSGFVDKSKRACGLIEENLDLLRVPEEQTGIFCTAAEKFVSRENPAAWNIVFYDPPYQADYGIVLSSIGREDSRVLAPDGILIVEHHSKRILPEAIGNIRRWRIVAQGETHLSFYERV